MSRRDEFVEKAMSWLGTKEGSKDKAVPYGLKSSAISL